jgi:zinc protease
VRAVGVFILLGLVAAATAPQIPPHPEELRFPASSFAPPDPAGTRFELANGMPVYVVPDRSLPLVDVVLALPVGDLHEQPEEAGMASMTAAMLRRGGAGELDPDRLDDEIDALGARIRTVGTSTRSVIALDCGSEALGRGLELFASILLEPRFEAQRLAQAKSNLGASLATHDDDPRRLLEREWLRLVHGDSAPRGRRLTPRAVAAFTSDALAGFHRRHYGPEGAVLAVSGDVDADAVVARLDELFGDWTAPDRDERSRTRSGNRGFSSDGNREGRPAPGSEAGQKAGAPGAAAMPGWWTLDRPGVQAAIAVGHRGAAFDSWDHRDRWALLVLTEILDGPGAVSRLRSRLQLGEGLTYRVLTYFDLDPVGRDGGAERAGEFRVFLETAPESAAEAAGAVLQELRRLQRDPVPATELETAKRSLLARFPLLFDGAEAVAGRYAEDELLGRPHEYWADYRQRLHRVTGADVLRAARRFLDPGGVALLVVGDWNAVRNGRGFQELRRAVGQPRALEER